MPWGEMVRILLDVLDGLAYAHGEGMVHRDIKPGNVMLTRRGQAVLTDFGIAQIVGGSCPGKALCLVGRRIKKWETYWQNEPGACSFILVFPAMAFSITRKWPDSSAPSMQPPLWG